MAIKSIIDIQINDQPFKRFNALYQQYQQSLAKQPKAWAAVTREINSGTKGFQELVAMEIAAIGKAKMFAEAQTVAARVTRTNADAWRDMARNTTRVAGNIKDTTTSLLKWASLTSVFTGLLGAGGLFGITRMAEGVAQGRQSSMGLGVRYGEQKAFSTNFDRLVNPNTFLSNIANVLSSADKSSLYNAGMSDKDFGGGAANVGVEYLKRARQFALRSDPSLDAQNWDSMGYSKNMSLEEFRKLRMGDQEFGSMVKGYGSDRTSMGLSGQDQLAWQNFTTQMTRAGEKIENVFVKGLSPLADPLTKLSDRFTEIVTALGNSGQLKEWMGKIGEGLDSFSKYLGTPDFKNDVETFVTGISVIAKKIADVVSWFGGGTIKREGHDTWNNMVDGGARLRREREETGVGKWTQLGRIFTGGGTGGENDLLALVRKLEGSGDSAVSRAGAVGRYQIMPGTARQYGFDPSRLTDSAYNEQAARAILRDLAKRYAGNTDEILAGYNAGPGGANKYRNSGHDPSSLPGETRAYLDHAHRLGAPSIVVYNKAGSDIGVQVTAGGFPQ